MWKKQCTTHSGYKFRVISDSFIVQMSGGSITIMERDTEAVLKRHTGHHYLYTGDISPDERQCFALENGKHFYVYSLESYDLIRRITLPKGYESIDVQGHYSENGQDIYIPAQRWIATHGYEAGHYEHVVCRYETGNYSLVEKTAVEYPASCLPEVDEIMRIIFEGME